MGRKKKEECEANHEAWAIPYADFLTLLLCFFIVLYALSTVNTAKYKRLAESLKAAFAGEPRSFQPIQVGNHPDQPQAHGVPNASASQIGSATPTPGITLPMPRHNSAGPVGTPADIAGLQKIADEVEQAIAPLIKRHLVVVHRNKYWLEVQIKTDILFPSGVATLSKQAMPVLDKLADILKPFPNPVRIEGYTDNVPIHNERFPSNWQLSASRAASVAQLFVWRGIDPKRLAIIGWSQYRPIGDNATAVGRNKNRRVTLVILGGSRVPERFYSDDIDGLQPGGGEPEPTLGQQSEVNSNAHLGGS